MVKGPSRYSGSLYAPTAPTAGSPARLPRSFPSFADNGPCLPPTGSPVALTPATHPHRTPAPPSTYPSTDSWLWHRIVPSPPSPKPPPSPSLPRLPPLPLTWRDQRGERRSSERGREKALPVEESAGVTGGESVCVSALLLRSRLQSPPPVMPALDPSGNASSHPSDTSSSPLSRNCCALPSGHASAPSVTIPLPQLKYLCRLHSDSNGRRVNRNRRDFGRGSGGRGWWSSWWEDSPEVMAMAGVAATTATAAFA